MGEGPLLVWVMIWGGGMELNWELPEYRAFIERLALGRLLVQIDRRGVGSSQREVDDLSLEAHLADIAAVADYLQLERFDLWGFFDGAAAAGTSLDELIGLLRSREGA